jgi:hypothetical protein
MWKTIAKALRGFGKAPIGDGAKTADVRMWRRQALEATVIKACKKCNAPGRYMSEARIKEGWPGCYVEPHSEREGEPVGSKCPNCGAKRPKNGHLGEIWKKEFR